MVENGVMCYQQLCIFMFMFMFLKLNKKEAGVSLFLRRGTTSRDVTQLGTS